MFANLAAMLQKLFQMCGLMIECIIKNPNTQDSKMGSNMNLKKKLHNTGNAI